MCGSEVVQLSPFRVLSLVKYTTTLGVSQTEGDRIMNPKYITPTPQDASPSFCDGVGTNPRPFLFPGETEKPGGT